MAGVFDSLMSDDPKEQAYMALAAGLLSGRGNFNKVAGEALMGSQNVYRQAQEAQQRREAQELQRQTAEMQLAQAKRQQRIAEMAKQYLIPGVKPETMDNRDVGQPGEQPVPATSFDMPGYITAMMGEDPIEALRLEAATRKQTPQPVAYKPGDVVGTWQGNQFVQGLKVPEKPEKDPEQIRVLKMIYGEGTPAYKQALERLGAKTTTHQPGTSVSVNTGQKGYVNESKLREDFKTEPIYKDYQEMLAAHQQIKVGIKQANPVGDLTAATKIMKLLDPQSVVRESELAMAMQASGRWDRLQHFAEIQINGEKLTPTQRVEFGKLADELLEAAGDGYNKKRGEYEVMGKRYGLDPTVLGAPHKPSKPAAGKWKIEVVP